MFYNECVGELDSPVKKVTAIAVGAVSLYTGCALSNLIWGIISLVVAGFIG